MPKDEITVAFASVLKKYRAAKGISQEKLAEKARDTGTLGRLQFYGAALCQFIATDIERYSGALCYSTGVATHHVPTVPE